ncbi:segregation/condensation protein A [Allobacillus sp. GCM10007491]|uniref:Segregation and condensation protein A n=1 Tax=Allobacillus saliphilus TaxID=2912308 RepID=A0A941CUD7_9BACI|nr:segregation/condensation protein A [Allobacillus saliphilus]
MQTYQVKFDTFEGPLDLLLHLVNQYEIDIYDVPLKDVADQYMNYIRTMQELQLDIASEYLVMAATLLAIKSQMLLPKQEVEMEDEYEEDLRDELIAKLIEYRKFKEAATELKEREQEQLRTHMRPATDLSVYQNETKVERSNELDIVDLTQAFQKVLRRKQLLEPLETTVQRQEISIEKRMDEIINTLMKYRGKRSFEELFPYQKRVEVVATFLAILELMKGMKIICIQNHNFDSITVQLTEEIYNGVK